MSDETKLHSAALEERVAKLEQRFESLDDTLCETDDDVRGLKGKVEALISTVFAMIETRKDAASEQPEDEKPEPTPGPIVRCPDCGEKLTCVVFEDGAWQVPTCKVEAARWEKARHEEKDHPQTKSYADSCGVMRECKQWEQASEVDADKMERGLCDEAAYTQMREEELRLTPAERDELDHLREVEISDDNALTDVGERRLEELDEKETRFIRAQIYNCAAKADLDALRETLLTALAADREAIDEQFAELFDAIREMKK